MMSSTSTTTLSQEDQNNILYWPRIAKLGAIRIDSTAKPKPIYDLERWRGVNLNDIDYESKVKSGWFDKGTAIRLGRTLDGKYYCIGIDFDGYDAVIAWSGSWENVLKVADRTRIEWHGDKGRI